jgi:hypothetical protein
VPQDGENAAQDVATQLVLPSSAEPMSSAGGPASVQASSLGATWEEVTQVYPVPAMHTDCPHTRSSFPSGTSPWQRHSGPGWQAEAAAMMKKVRNLSVFMHRRARA